MRCLRTCQPRLPPADRASGKVGVAVVAGPGVRGAGLVVRVGKKQLPNESPSTRMPTKILSSTSLCMMVTFDAGAKAPTALPVRVSLLYEISTRLTFDTM